MQRITLKDNSFTYQAIDAEFLIFFDNEIVKNI